MATMKVMQLQQQSLQRVTPKEPQSQQELVGLEMAYKGNKQGYACSSYTTLQRVAPKELQSQHDLLGSEVAYNVFIEGINPTPTTVTPKGHSKGTPNST